MHALKKYDRAVVALAAATFATHALAHASAHALGWNWQPWILAGLAIAVLGYLRGLLRMEPSARARVFDLGRRLAFAAGVGVLFAVLISPLDALDDQLFSAHMVQHMALMLVAPPLLVWARPATAWLWAFPLPARRAIGRFWMHAPGVQRGMRAVTGPLAVWLLSSAALWFWHLPGPYRWALGNETVHSAEHLIFFITSLAFWSLLLAPYGRRQLDYGPSLIFAGTLGMQMGLLGAILTFATRPLYVSDPVPAARWGMSLLQDQQIAGLIMWVPAGLVYLVAMLLLFGAWLRDAERQAVRASALRSVPLLRAVTTVSCVTLLLSGCHTQETPPRWQINGAQPARGPALLVTYGCGSCHTVPGVDQARGTVGPPLTQFAQRGFIAGTLPNDPDNLMRWLRFPQQVLPGNAMPDTGVTARDARDISAYLYTLQ